MQRSYHWHIVLVVGLLVPVAKAERSTFEGQVPPENLVNSLNEGRYHDIQLGLADVVVANVEGSAGYVQRFGATLDGTTTNFSPFECSKGGHCVCNSQPDFNIDLLKNSSFAAYLVTDPSSRALYVLSSKR